ncbi:MAG: tetratricopeptide repeat protein [Verrucomicrobiales bacterium]|jgi:outer membrane protein assembly factor BamD|nr:tetratricopeptide repeat protein [Verrucomicrobiales bacterium]
MTKTSLRGTLAVALLLGLATLQPSHAIFGIFSKKDRDRVPTKKEVAEHDRKASNLFAKAEANQKASKGKKALDQYSTISRKYYFSQYAAEANFRAAELLQSQGELSKAFEYYQTLVDRYRGSSRFQRAVEQQYNMTVAALTEKKDSFLGVVPKKMSRDNVLEMFGTIITNAPASIYAANSQYYIARIHEGLKRYDEAITAFQAVVDEYPRSPKAPQAQLKIAEIYDLTNRRPDSPANLTQSREAYEDFLTNFPQHRESGDAYAQLNSIDEKTARNSLKFGQFYEKQGNMKGAAIYYKDVLLSSNAALKLEARQGIDRVGNIDPKALELAQIDEAATKAAPSERLKAQRNYLGPPAPDLGKKKPTRRSMPISEPAPKKDTPLVPSNVQPVPLPVAPEPDLPGKTPGFDVDPLVPSPPSASDSDILGLGDAPVVDADVDIDSLLPPVPEEGEGDDGE